MEVHDENGHLVLADADTRVLDAVLSQQAGYILDFSNRTFDQFMLQRHGVDAAAPEFERFGPSKANRLRSILSSVAVPGNTKADILDALFDWREDPERHGQFPELSEGTAKRFGAIVDRLRGVSSEASSTSSASWTGRPTIKERIVVVRELAPLALLELERLIVLVDDRRCNDPETADALDALRRLHAELGALIKAIDGGLKLGGIFTAIGEQRQNLVAAMRAGAHVAGTAPALTFGVVHILAAMMGLSIDTTLVAGVYATLVTAPTLDRLGRGTAKPVA